MTLQESFAREYWLIQKNYLKEGSDSKIIIEHLLRSKIKSSSKVLRILMEANDPTTKIDDKDLMNKIAGMITTISKMPVGKAQFDYMAELTKILEKYGIENLDPANEGKNKLSESKAKKLEKELDEFAKKIGGNTHKLFSSTRKLIGYSIFATLILFLIVVAVVVSMKYGVANGLATFIISTLATVAAVGAFYLLVPTITTIIKEKGTTEKEEDKNEKPENQNNTTAKEKKKNQGNTTNAGNQGKTTNQGNTTNTKNQNTPTNQGSNPSGNDQNKQPTGTQTGNKLKIEKDLENLKNQSDNLKSALYLFNNRYEY